MKSKSLMFIIQGLMAAGILILVVTQSDIYKESRPTRINYLMHNR